MRPWAKRWLVPGLGLVVLGIALMLLRRQLQDFSPAQVREGLAAIPPARLLLALGFTAVGFVCLTGYEWISARHVGVDEPFRRVGLAGFLGYAFSQSLGFPLLTGAPLRYRLYTSWGVEGVTIARLIGFSTLTFWVGFTVLGGVTFLLVPPQLPVDFALSGGSLRLLGGLLALVGAGYALACWRFEGRELGTTLGLPIPSLGVAARQMLVATAEWSASAAALYILLPAGTGLTFPALLAVFLLAQVAGFLSTVPQGLGVFETVLLAALPDASVDGALVASVVAFRTVYYLAPLMAAAVVLAVLEFRRREDAIESAVSALRSGISSSVPVVLSGAVFVAGALLLATGALPVSGRLSWLGRLPLPLLEASHFFGSVAGASLLILSWGLARRLDGAFHATLWLLVAAAGAAVFQGDGAGAVVALLVLAGVLLSARREFFRPTALTHEPLSPEWIAGVVAVLGATVWLGFWAYRDIELSAELWWRFALTGDGPRFLRGAVGGTAVLFLFTVSRLLRAPEPDDAGVEGLTDGVVSVLSGSPRPSARLGFLGDKHVLMSKSGRALIMYGVEGRSWVAMGDPVGDPEDFPDLIWMFRSRTFRHGGWPVFYQVTPACLPLYIDAGLGLLKLGEEAIVDVQGFTLDGGARAGMRKTVRKAEKEGATFDLLDPGQVAVELPRLRAISDTWLAAKSAKEKGFSLGSFSEEYIARFPVAVVRVEGTIVAFANMWLGADGREYSLDLMRYEPETSPDGVMQYLFAQSLLWGKEQGYTRFSMGMAPLSGLDSGPLAPLAARLGALVFRHGEHFYNFQGLKAYKEKFDPVWEPRYLASPGGLALPRIVGNITTLISGGVRGVLLR